MSRRVTVALHLILTWFLYNLGLLFVLLITCKCFDGNEWETLITMGIFSIGINWLQYDLWVLRREKFKREQADARH